MLGRMFPRGVFKALLPGAGLSAGGQARARGVFNLDKDRGPMMVLNGACRILAGDDARWPEPGFDDSGRSVVKGDKDWASQGYPGMSVFGWYRPKPVIPEERRSSGCSYPGGPSGPAEVFDV